MNGFNMSVSKSEKSFKADQNPDSSITLNSQNMNFSPTHTCFIFSRSTPIILLRARAEE